MRDINVIIRMATLEDWNSILGIQREVISEGEYLITVSEEFVKTASQQKEWLKKILENENEILLVAEVDGTVVGMIVFFSQTRKRVAHVGSFGMMILDEFRGRGIGQMLIKALLEWAEIHPTIEKVCLGVFSTNHRAIALYKKMGFQEEGRKIKEFKINENTYIDDVLMFKFVK